MLGNGYSAIILAGNCEFQQKGYIRYYADWRLHGGSAYMVIPMSGDPILFLGLGAQAEWAKELSAVKDTRGVIDKIESLLTELRTMTAAGDRVGVVGLTNLVSFGDATRLLRGLEDRVVEDATHLVEDLWTTLSTNDAVAVEVSHCLVSRIFDAFRDALRPGRTEREVVADAYRVAIQGGCLEGVIHLNHDMKSGTRPATDRQIDREDIYKMFMEFLTPGGYLIELGGCFSFRAPNDGWQRKFDLVALAISEAMTAIRPGMIADDVVQVIRRTYEKAGVEIVGRRLWDFHGQGMHSLLRPFGMPGSVDPITDNMMINIHPGLITSDRLGISATNNYIVTPSGGRALGDFQHRWHVVG